MRVIFQIKKFKILSSAINNDISAQFQIHKFNFKDMLQSRLRNMRA